MGLRGFRWGHGAVNGAMGRSVGQSMGGQWGCGALNGAVGLMMGWLMGAGGIRWGCGLLADGATGR